MRIFLAALLLVLVSGSALASEPVDQFRFGPGPHFLSPLKSVDYPRKRADRHVSRKRHDSKLARTVGSGTGVAPRGLDPAAPAPLNVKVAEIINDCGSHIASGFRPGARVRGSGALSNHALHRAYDLKGNPACIYSKLHGWPGGYSTDYHSAPGGSHVHISYNPSKEWGLRFVHNGGRYARRHRGRVS